METTRIQKLIKRDGPICQLCKKSLVKEYRSYLKWKKGQHRTHKTRRSKANINIDHINPRSKGGNMGMKNCQLTHQDCNTLKSDL